MPDYPLVRLLAPAALADLLLELSAGFPMLGIETEDRSGGDATMRVYFPPDGRAAAEELARVLVAAGGRQVRCEDVAGEDWLAGYRASVLPFPVGEMWWLDPHPDDPTPAPDDRHRLVVEPRSAFGSGSHESTRLVLLELEELAGESRSFGATTVLDLGTGSGILALAAERLGSPWVVGLDVDPTAVWVARQTVVEQDWDAAPRLVVGSSDCIHRGGFDLVLCNMISESFLPLLGDVIRMLATDGRVVFSGILLAQREEILEALALVGLRVQYERRLDQWLCLRATMDRL